MKKFESVWAVSDCTTETEALIGAASSFSDRITLALCVGDSSYLNYIDVITERAAQAAPGAVIVPATRNGRLLAGVLAARLGTVVITDPAKAELSDAGVLAEKLVYGGNAIRRDLISAATAVLCLNCDTFRAETPVGAYDSVEIAPAEAVELVERRVVERRTVNLGAAKRVVCAGRGVASEEMLQSLRAFAGSIGAELCCTRPLAEESRLLPRELYVGVSGAMIKPELYIGAGVSGQVQHMVGVNDSKVIFAINKDKNAPIFKQCDHGLVADLNQVLPALTEALTK